MEDALRASPEGLEQVDRARKRKGWNRQSAAWAEAALTSVASLKQFWRGERIQRDSFIRICEAVGLVEWQAIAADSTDSAISSSPSPQPASFTPTICEWGEAPELPFFCGRQEELATLEQWILGDRCKLISILGMGGMGKTTLAVQLAEQLVERMAGFVWRSLRTAPPLADLLTDLLRALNPQQTELPESTEARLSQLMAHLRERGFLLVLDNAESILAEGDSPGGAGYFRAGYEGYSDLLRRIGEERHQSCLVLTSREQPRTVSLLEGEKVRSLRLRGLPLADGQALLEKVGTLGASHQDCAAIVEHYAGNPLALKIVAAGIRDVLDRNVTDFLALMQQDRFAFVDIQDLLERHFNRLSLQEQEVLLWLAIACEPVPLEELKADLLSPSRLMLPKTLDSLNRRSLLEVTPAGFTLQPAVMAYATQWLIRQVSAEIGAQAPNWLRSHALLKATAKDYISEAQTRLILEPLAELLRSRYGSTAAIAAALRLLLPPLRGKSALETGYVGGNVVNLLHHLQVDLTDWDFSQITLWQADLRQVCLHRVDVSGADLARSSLTEPFGSILCVAFSPDGNLAARSDDGGWISVWEVATGRQVLSVKAHTDWAFSITFSPDSRVIATGSLDRSVKLWDLATGQCLQTFLHHRAGVGAIAFHPNATWEQGILASGGADQTIRLLDLATGACCGTFTGQQGLVRSLVFSPEGHRIASASLDGTVKVWEIGSGQELQTLVHGTPVYALAFDPAAPTTLATAADDAIRRWNTVTGECLQVIEGHGEPIWSLAYSPDGDWIVSGSDDRTLKVWDSRTGRCLRTLQGHQERIWSVALSPDSGTILSGSGDRTVRLWDLASGQCLRTLRGYANNTMPIAFSPAGQLLTFSADQTLRFWNSFEQDATPQKTLPVPTKTALQAALSPEQTLLATGSLAGAIRLCQVETGLCVSVLKGHTSWVRGVAFNPDGTLLASAGGDRTVKLWQVKSGACLKTLAEHTNAVSCVAFHPDGRLLASSSWDCTIKLWDVETGDCLQTLERHRDRVMAISFSTMGEWLISSSQDHTLCLWDWQQGVCLESLEAHSAGVVASAWSPQGNRFASASRDGTICLWQIGSSRQKNPKPRVECLHRLSGPAIGFDALVFSPDGEVLASGSENGSVTLWEVATGQCLTTLQVPRPYEGMNIQGVQGVTPAQTMTLKHLGAIDPSTAQG